MFLLGSATINIAPLFTASSMCIPIIGCCSVVFEPMTKITLASAISLIELVIAPEPNVLARPPNVDEWQSLAQWSMLFVPNTALANFIIR